MNDTSKTRERRLHGAWAHLTLDALLDTAVRARPQRRSFADAPDIANWSDLKGKSTTIGELGDSVNRFARQIRTLGLKERDPVIVAMPNCVDGVVTLLGLITAGFVPCPVSVVANAAEMQEAAEAVGAKAIITVNRYASFQPSDAARQAASRFYGVRFVCAFGPNAPEGVVSLDDWSEAELSAEPLPVGSATAPALITLERSDDMITAHVRSHAQLISDALALSAISGLTGRGSIIATFAPVSAAGFISTVASPLISGTMVGLHGPFDAGVLKLQVNTLPEAIVVLPAAVEDTVTKALGIHLRDTIVVTRDLSQPRHIRSTGRVTELVSLGEAALWSLLRDNNRSKTRLPRFYAHPVGTALPRTAPQIEITLSPRGRLSLSGFGVARIRTAGNADGLETAHVETRWLGHGDGPEHYVMVPGDADLDGEAAAFAAAAA
jgi:acyl-CoA synthetase (AMP-forming)/AMP-acid ligase II